MFRSLLLACALVGAIAFVGSAAGGGTGWPHPSARDKALLASVLHGMRTDLRKVRLAQLPAYARKGRPQGTLELIATGRVSGKAYIRWTRVGWDTLLIAHAYNERCIRDADHCVAVYSGPSVGGGGAGRSRAKRPYWSARALTRVILRRFAAVGLRDTAVAFERPNAFAPIITVRTSHPRRAHTAEGKAWVALLPTLRRHSDGVFIQMFDARGRVFYISAGSGNTGMGWCAPVLKCPGTGP